MPGGAVRPIQITGLRDLQKALKDLDGESQKQLRVVFNQAGAAVVRGAASRVPARTGKARKSLRATSGQREAKVTGGNKQAEYYGFLDFGGTVGRKRSVKRQFITEGRYMYPAYSANSASIQKGLEKAIVDMCRATGLSVDG